MTKEIYDVIIGILWLIGVLGIIFIIFAVPMILDTLYPESSYKICIRNCPKGWKGYTNLDCLKMCNELNNCKLNQEKEK